ncbi:MAG TPA: polymer-forming cytoskeletal protein [Gemmatimonadales bacterium]|nr:polymer-forming cytoskeletal protein [Gemmatimonadales bacterium]
MGIFSAPSTTAAPFVERRRNNVPQGGLSIVAKDLTIAGDLQAEGVIRIEGRVVGNVHAGDQVLISEGGIVEGDVVSREAVIAGRVHGCIHGEERVELQAAAVVHGDITTRRLLIHEGGQVNGGVKMETMNGVPAAIGNGNGNHHGEP